MSHNILLTEKKNIKIRIMKVNRSCFYFNEVIDREFFFSHKNTEMLMD